MPSFIASRSQQAAAFGVLAGCLLLASQVGAADAVAGERLAIARCVSCHSSSEPIHSTLPVLEGQPRSAFIAQWRAFRERKRTAPVMVSLAEELSEREVEDLAEYYAARLPPRDSGLSDSRSGRELANRLQCATCHGAQFQGSSSGVPRLAGQRARYTTWSLQLMRGGTRSHGTAASPDPLLARLTNAEIESLAVHFASLR